MRVNFESHALFSWILCFVLRLFLSALKPSCGYFGLQFCRDLLVYVLGMVECNMSQGICVYSQLTFCS